MAASSTRRWSSISRRSGWKPEPAYYAAGAVAGIAARSGMPNRSRLVGVGLTEDGRDRSLDHKLTPIHIAPSLPEGLPVPSLARVGDEIMLQKTSSGVFNSTNIDYVLKNLGVRYLVVAGIMTDQCVDMAVSDAADRGYLVTCVSDACAAATQERHDGALKTFGGYCWLADTATVAARFDILGNA
ncbi:MAG: cysteine hydrolase [Mesorhizobium sp.]|nr:MAG: cysteine hydrolase [Mesorhizobium sp.]